MRPFADWQPVRRITSVGPSATSRFARQAPIQHALRLRHHAVEPSKRRLHRASPAVRAHRRIFSSYGVRSSGTLLVGLTLGSGAAAADVDAAPPGAIIGIAAQSVRLVNVVGVAVRIARVFEDPRQLTCRKLARGLRRYQGKASTLSLTSGNGASQRGAKRNPQKDRSSHCRPCARRIGRCASNPLTYVGMGPKGAQIETLIYFGNSDRALGIRAVSRRPAPPPAARRTPTPTPPPLRAG